MATKQPRRARPAPAVKLGPGIVVGPVVHPPPSPVGNFFNTSRPGRAVLRPDDLLALRFELRGLAVTPGNPPRLKKSGSGAAQLVVHFPPQSITEQTFFETRPGAPGTENPSGPPVRARIAGESRLAFTVPDGFDVPYTLDGLLGAIESLTPSVAANAVAGGSSTGVIRIQDLFAASVNQLGPRERAQLSSFAMRSLRIAAVQSDVTTLRLRQSTGGVGLKPLGRISADALAAVPVSAPRPAAPGPGQTAIELPWRLILSPHAGTSWRHAHQPVASPSGHVELWHTRLVVPVKGGTVEPPRPDAQRTVRAIWALTGEGSPQAMDGAFPGPLPAPSDAPFRMPMDDSDRFQIVHLSSNFSRRGYVPKPVDTNLMMLSSLGAWLDSRGAWTVPPGLSVQEWQHRATMGRDHYVKVVYKGYLFPLGHCVSLVKVSERKFHNGAINAQTGEGTESKPGNTAFLRQRLFIVVHEREKPFVETGLKSLDNARRFQFQMPCTQVRILTEKTPNLDLPGSDAAKAAPFNDRRMFWPCVDGQPLRFQCSAVDVDGRRVTFDLPMIFIDNTLLPDIATAEANVALARAAWAARPERQSAPLRMQRLALAVSAKAGDTTVQAESMRFDAEVEPGNATLRAYATTRLIRPPFYPKITEVRARIAALAQLTGSSKLNTLVWNAHYLANGFDAGNQGQVFVDVKSEPGMATLDFSTQGDRSGGFVQPNLRPSALSRLAGPVSGNVASFVAGNLSGSDAFPKTLSDLPLPLLFGCIPLGDVIQAVSGLAGKPEQIPKFASEGSTQIESFVNALVRLFDFVGTLADQPGRAAEGAIEAVKQTLNDLLDQMVAYAAGLVADVKARVGQLVAALNGVLAQVQQLKDKTLDTAPALAGLPGAITAVQTAVANLRSAANASVGGVSLPAGLRQGLLQAAQGVELFVGDLGTVLALVTQAKALFTALDAIVGHPEAIGDLFSDPAQLKTRLQAVQAALTPMRTTLAGFRLLDGAPRQAILAAIDAVVQVLGGATELLNLLEMLTGDELTVRFDWNPPIDSWGFEPGAPLFRANDKRGFRVAVEAKVKKNGQSAPKISVVCSLKSFDLVLIAPASFIELNFEKIEFRVDSAAKMNVDVLLTDIKFVGPLSFVETLRDLIPLDGFTDPPYLDITTKGIDAGFDLALPAVSVGMFNLSNLSLGAGFTVPFIGQPLSVRFNFCTREQPFNLSVCLFGGGGFFGITLDPSGIQILEASFEFGASLSVNLGVASGGVHVMAGLYFRMEKTACSLTGYFRLGGNVSVLGLISASIELYLELRYEFESGKCVGKAQLTIEIEIFFFSFSVTITCERKFAGSNGDPTLRDLMGLQPALPLDDELALIDDQTAYAWREYMEAFA